MKNSELERLRDKCLFYTQFLIQKLSDSPELIKGLEETYRLVEKAYQDEKIKPLRAMSAEIDDQVICHMPLSMAVEFKNLIKEKLKINYNDVNKTHMKVVERILKKEKIYKRKEYKLIVNRIDKIFADINKAEKLKKLNKLLLEYENQNKI